MLLNVSYPNANQITPWRKIEINEFLEHEFDAKSNQQETPLGEKKNHKITITHEG